MTSPEVSRGDFVSLPASVLERARQAHWMSLEAEKSCVDGRGTDAIIGVPGGDAGLLATTLATVEKMAQRMFTKEEVAAALDLYKENIGKGRFYFHTDDHAHDPAEGEEIHEHNIGCGHLKLAVKDPERYGMRADLVKNLLAAAHGAALLEATSPIQARTVDKIILTGEHREEGVIIVANMVNNQVPAIVPNFKGKQMFVFHSAVVVEMAGKIAQNLGSLFPGTEIDPTTFKQQFVKMFLNQTQKTAETLARNKATGEPLPQYHLSILQNESGGNEVVEIQS